jgi:uncharacterized protein
MITVSEVRILQKNYEMRFIMDTKKEQITIAIGGALLGMIAVALSYFGNPANMGFCIACFIRDSAGALGLHRAAAVEYLRPEIIGVVLGAFLISIIFPRFCG